MSDLTSVEAKREYDEQQKKENILGKWFTVPLEDTYADRDLEKILKGISSQSFRERLADANIASQRIGNTYTASVFMGLASLIDIVGKKELNVGKTLIVFSYGSGALATMYRLHIREPKQSIFSISKMATVLNLIERLDARTKLDASELDKALDARAKMHLAGAPYTPEFKPFNVHPSTYYLESLGPNFVRKYNRATGI